MTTTGRLLPRLLAVGTVLLALAACGDDDGDSVGGTTPTTGAAGDDTATTAAAAELEGEPVRAVAIVDENEAAGFTNDALRGGLEAAVAGVNERGGIGGRPLEVEVCNAAFQAQAAEACARDAVDDPSVIAVIGSAYNEPDVVNPILEEAGMASLAPLPVALGDFNSPISFPVMSGAVTAGGAASLAVDVLGAERITMGRLDVAGAEQAEALVGAVLGVRGLAVTTSIPIPIDKPDLAAEAAQLSSDADAIVPLLEPNAFGRLVDALDQQGSEVPIVASAATAALPTLRDLGDAADGIYIAAGLALEGMPGEWVSLVHEEIRALDPDASIDDNAKNAWLAVNLLAEVAGALDSVDRGSFLAALQAADDVDTRGLTPPIDFTAVPTALGGALPRLFNATVVYGQWDGEVVGAIDGTFVDPFVAP